MTSDDTNRWIDPEAIRELVVRVREGYESAPAWVQVALLAMVGVGVLVEICRIARSLVARLVGIFAAAVVAVILRFYGHELFDRLSAWLT